MILEILTNDTLRNGYIVFSLLFLVPLAMWFIKEHEGFKKRNFGTFDAFGILFVIFGMFMAFYIPIEWLVRKILGW